MNSARPPQRSSDSGLLTLCNHAWIAQLQQQSGLSDSQLAKEIGCDAAHFIDLAAGRPVPKELFEPLARVLSRTPGEYTAADLICRPDDYARQYVLAMYTHQADAPARIRHFLDDDIIFKISGDPAVIPFAGEHRGFDAIVRAIQVFFSILEVPPNHDPLPYYRFTAHGPHALVVGQSWIHPIGRPMDRPMPISNLLRFRRGKLYYYDDNYDTKFARELFKESNSPDVA